jgi:hypothetical protein
VACGGSNEGTGDSADTTIPEPPQTLAPVVELRAVGKSFQGPSQIPSGWTTFRFVNASAMTHFALIDLPPAGISLGEISETLMAPFQEVMDAMNNDDEGAVNAAFSTFPAWITELGRAGGPGFLSPGLTGQTTVYLEPGRYVIECYVKSDGVFHSTSPGNGKLGMVMELTVTEADNAASEPVPDVTIALRNTGIELLSGELTEGINTLRVDFLEQQALPSFVGNDLHLIRVDGPDTIPAVNAWMDWRSKGGLEDPAPAQFLGGINDLPQGKHGYFTVDLEPGDYALVAEVPDPQAAGFVWPFSVE